MSEFTTPGSTDRQPAGHDPGDLSQQTPRADGAGEAASGHEPADPARDAEAIGTPAGAPSGGEGGEARCDFAGTRPAPAGPEPGPSEEGFTATLAPDEDDPCDTATAFDELRRAQGR
ncbi:hypothetical protein [Leucobacter massiliensis]|uniref:Uncharacterized protein n=1 Tax=Leucobacter massiliensis TaxID=1686285 RepID=A0A2S9QN62_9MICO|nr:hypothetical protein [Leucobacter massiliensis]PRI11025.1 hypothetical protein B4915_09140 [Leucobacter massiliensis]